MLEIYIGIGAVIFFLYICEVGGLRSGHFDKVSIIPGLFVGVLWPMAVFGLVVYLFLDQMMRYLTRD